MLSFQSWVAVYLAPHRFNCLPVVVDCSFYISRCMFVISFLFVCLFLFVRFKICCCSVGFLLICSFVGLFFVIVWFLFLTEFFHHSVSWAPTHFCKMVPMVTLNVFLRALLCPLRSFPSEEELLLWHLIHTTSLLVWICFIEHFQYIFYCYGVLIK